MAMANPYAKYQNNTVTTASPQELTFMLYNGCLKFMNQAKAAMQEENIEERNRLIGRAQAIVQEFMVTLDLNADVSKGMLQLYDYANSKLVDANVKNDLASLEQAEEVIQQLRDTWKEAMQLNRQQQFGNKDQA
ncbi:flagellar export chaperone FliS [Jeotgalibacillus sp. R-1-5s-1]|uniref:flagellar export chaperone FliS n=1 Tax=Jeotgalibacillus sp. R-1-5s-1 TaxID=2555897 RepID=UPI00106B1C0A|nr:flagellar export chaperone FliS [Jeotgalibacillus sp. R-1-5s-1]TFD95804.1 flagellar export chaperone FliS [Jeotgalibacillus sp. R-1-5s-1]